MHSIIPWYYDKLIIKSIRCRGLGLSIPFASFTIKVAELHYFPVFYESFPLTHEPILACPSSSKTPPASSFILKSFYCRLQILNLWPSFTQVSQPVMRSKSVPCQLHFITGTWTSPFPPRVVFCLLGTCTRGLKSTRKIGQSNNAKTWNYKWIKQNLNNK